MCENLDLLFLNHIWVGDRRAQLLQLVLVVIVTDNNYWYVQLPFLSLSLSSLCVAGRAILCKDGGGRVGADSNEGDPNLSFFNDVFCSM
jgi:hypothetical protein